MSHHPPSKTNGVIQVNGGKSGFLGGAESYENDAELKAAKQI